MQKVSFDRQVRNLVYIQLNYHCFGKEKQINIENYVDKFEYLATTIA